MLAADLRTSSLESFSNFAISLIGLREVVRNDQPIALSRISGSGSPSSRTRIWSIFLEMSVVHGGPSLDSSGKYSRANLSNAAFFTFRFLLFRSRANSSRLSDKHSAGRHSTKTKATVLVFFNHTLLLNEEIRFTGTVLLIEVEQQGLAL